MSEPLAESQAESQPEQKVESQQTEPQQAQETGQQSVPAVDPRLLGARDLAREALAEITEPNTIGGDAGHEVHDEITVTLYFESKLPGYPGWRWAAALAKVSDEDPINVLEVELLPGEGAVLAPEWVPWSERLAQYRESQSRLAAEEARAAEEAAEELADLDDLDDLDDDVMENDYSDFDGDIDGVDIDELDEDDSDGDDFDGDDFDGDDSDDDINDEQ